jgi:hypothetical protein
VSFFWRYQISRLIVGFGLLILLILPTEFLIGYLTSVMPTAIAVGIGLLAWIGGTMLATQLIIEKLSRQWPR